MVGLTADNENLWPIAKLIFNCLTKLINPPWLHPLVVALGQTAVCWDVQGDQLRKAGAVKAFRSQLPRHNEYYGSEPSVRGSAPPLPLQVPCLPQDTAATHLCTLPAYY